MNHDFFCIRDMWKVKIRCHHCQHEWDIHFHVTAFFIIIRYVIIGAYLFFALLLPINRIIAFAFSFLVVPFAYDIPAILFCKFLNKNGKYEKYLDLTTENEIDNR